MAEGHVDADPGPCLLEDAGSGAFHRGRANTEVSRDPRRPRRTGSAAMRESSKPEWPLSQNGYGLIVRGNMMINIDSRSSSFFLGKPRDISVVFENNL